MSIVASSSSKGEREGREGRGRERCREGREGEGNGEMEREGYRGRERWGRRDERRDGGRGRVILLQFVDHYSLFDVCMRCAHYTTTRILWARHAPRLV